MLATLEVIYALTCKCQHLFLVAMIYDHLLYELKQMGGEAMEQDLSNVRICGECGATFTQNHKMRRYCSPVCSRKAGLRKKRELRLHNRATKPLCTCCGFNPVGDGLRFLCSWCYSWDGSDWLDYDVMQRKGSIMTRITGMQKVHGKPYESVRVAHA